MTTTVTILGGPEYEIKRKQTQAKRFSMTRRFKMKYSKDNIPDLLDLLGLLSKGAMDLFLVIKCGADYKSNITVLDTSKESASDRTRRNKLLRELRSHDLVRRVPRTVERDGVGNITYPKNTVIVNPDYIRPPLDLMDEVIHTYSQSK